ncbi:interferon-induced very large GTPase 1-like [Ruditapes philippinarum]|uniref:interferon-induced very large GTPase 1-like n=1 Tax=Ruditapes philippinarum TaxID=129788 RepID=UPI00295B5A11|nr:interferon-induced very large GTPase 1-like [Ruditapes philippinarum]
MTLLISNLKFVFILTDIVASSKDIFFQTLTKLGLANRHPGAISIRDIVAVDASEWKKKENGTVCSTDIPWLVLKRLISSNSESRDISVTNEQDLNNGNVYEDTLSFLSDMPDDKQEDISPLDVFLTIFQCCDPFLKQVVVQKLYLCKIAVPFLYKYWEETNEQQMSVLSVWPLRSLAIENKQRNYGNNEVQCQEIDILELQTKMIAFGRLGRPRYSKSKLMNSILSDHGCKTFFNFDSLSGMTKRKLSNGHVEMFWLPLIGDKRDIFQEAMTFLNLRGDLEHDFDAEIQHFISTFVDTLTIVVDIETILKRSRNVIDILLKCSSVILIIANPITQETKMAIHEFKYNVLKLKPNITLRVLSTYKGKVEQNAVDMVAFISVHITDQLKSNCTKSYHERLQQAKVKIIIDEDDKNCQIGKHESNKMIKQMNREGLSNTWKQTLTPVHSKFSKELGKLIKKREREKSIQGGNAIDTNIKNIREAQIKAITKSVKLFTYMLQKYENKFNVMKYFLCWLHLSIEKEKRQSLPPLIDERRLAWRKLKLLKSQERQVQSDIVEQENSISELEERINEASFLIEHFFREIGHINEAILELGKDSVAYELPPLGQISKIIGFLVADGHQLELIDGESFYMPYRWLKAVVNEVDKFIGAGKVLALSVLGLQSSGKSTLLNTMFGCQFSTRTGRCTRGIHAQLIPVDISKCDDKLSDYNFILVVDTEGLRSPELSHYQHEHDNELATVITGIGDVTLINIMGENTSEIRDILQVIVHAFLRLKMTNKDLDIKKSCSFLHQNVTDTSASDKMMSGLRKLIQTLDEMTKESAESENIKNITTFNQVIEFDINSQVWYLKNLWQGNPPMARVNTEYSEKVIDIRSSILKKALAMKDKSYKSLDDITEHAHNLWKGVLNEDFVFSFRNSIEIKAYKAMEHVVQVSTIWRS